MPYHHVKIELTERQAKKAMKGGAIRINNDQIGRGRLILHPVNKRKIEKAIMKGKAINIELSPAELAETALHHIREHGMDGSGFWGKIWNGLKKGWKFLKDSGIAKIGLDAAAVPLSTLTTGSPASAPVIRNLMGAVTGTGIRKVKTKKITDDSKLKASGLYLS